MATLLLLSILISIATTLDLSEIVTQWSITPYHSKVELNSIQDVLNPLPITIEFIMSSAHFKQYGALFHYQIIKDSTKYNADYEIHQFPNSDNNMVKTQISNVKIPWNQLTNAKLEDFINKPLDILVSYNDYTHIFKICFGSIQTSYIIEQYRLRCNHSMSVT